jgi:nucleoside-diphosphate-sugar epimerase
MGILIAGASGVIGHALVKLLVASGHAVTGTTRSPARAAAIRAAGATPLVLNVFDAQPLADALAAARPEVVVHQLTDLPDRLEPGGLVDALARNARIRTEGTRNLVAAAVRAGTRRLVAQSIAWAYAPGTEPHDEDDPLDMSAEGVRAVTVLGVAELERLVTSVPRIDGLVLRYGQIYGPGTWSAGPSGSAPVHVGAAARAAALAVARGLPGIYNIVEDGGSASNAKARAQLGWDPRLT